MDTSAIILAAGEGTRMKSDKPKVAHELLGRPLVKWVVNAARDAGVERPVCVVGHGREIVQPLVEDSCEIAVQQGRLGTADAVSSAAPQMRGRRGSVLVLSGDCPLITSRTLQALAAAREESNAGVVVLTMQLEDPTGYGRIVRDSTGNLLRIVEQKDCTPEELAQGECNSGFYCFDIELLFDALGKVGSDNAQGEFYLTDVIEIARREGRTVVGLKAEDPVECLGINTRVQLAQATHAMQERINYRHMLAGVTMWDPQSTFIGPDVKIEPDVEILPQTFLMGATSIARDCVLGPNTRLDDCVVGRGCTLDETVGIESRLDGGCTCGPRAYLRPGTHLCEGAKVGTHVEIKKSTIGAGSKVPHLSYIGDTTMGAGVNIGAGSITCNYDGQKKWSTTIGDDTFVGSDTMMVAPVNIGRNAVVGAGSVITEDVPDNALAIARGRQFVKEGYRASESE